MWSLESIGTNELGWVGWKIATRVKRTSFSGPKDWFHSGCADEVWIVPCGPRPDKPLSLGWKIPTIPTHSLPFKPSGPLHQIFEGLMNQGFNQQLGTPDKLLIYHCCLGFCSELLWFEGLSSAFPSIYLDDFGCSLNVHKSCSNSHGSGK